MNNIQKLSKEYIVGLGEILFDCLPEGKKLGGAPANFAYHASQFGLNGIAVSAIGPDELGNEILSQLGEKNLQTRLEMVDYPTGTVQVTLSGEGIPQYDICEGVAYDNIPWTPEIEAIAKETRAVCFGTLAQRNEASRATIQKFVEAMPEYGLKIYDINLRQHFYNQTLIEDNLNRCNILKINDEELEILGEMFGYPELLPENKCWILLAKYNLDILILTCGTEGSYAFTKGNVSFQPTPKVTVADTVGAGDSFTSTFCSAILNGKSVADAHKLAVEVSAYVCTQNGAMPVLPKELVERAR
ncbi:MAG: carbohydrate kinase [Bacteroidaceae bacterium]|nr:carbohydrate kinase [Bacteroidaceae bacterium]